MTCLYLQESDSYNRVLINEYLSKDDENTTEIDLIKASLKMIFVFEFKNYSSWIFENESDKMWTQVLKGGVKYRFSNPFWKNKGHIAAIDRRFKGRCSDKLRSYIVFSERCTLKDVIVTSKGVQALKRSNLYPG